jgi:hypothetical protein
LVQFILTVQRDVEQRISEYSMGKCFSPSESAKLLRTVRYCAGNIELCSALQGEFVWL